MKKLKLVEYMCGSCDEKFTGPSVLTESMTTKCPNCKTQVVLEAVKKLERLKNGEFLYVEEDVSGLGDGFDTVERKWEAYYKQESAKSIGSIFLVSNSGSNNTKLMVQLNLSKTYAKTFDLAQKVIEDNYYEKNKLKTIKMK